MIAQQELAQDFAAHSGPLCWQRSFALCTLIAIALVAAILRGASQRRPWVRRAQIPLTVLIVTLSLAATYGLLAMKLPAAKPHPYPRTLYYFAPADSIPRIHLRST